MTQAAIIGPRDESGPSTRILEGPKIAYPTRHRIEVYRPVIGGRPANSAYAIPCGTSRAVRINPAVRSFPNHPGRYDRSTPRPGTARTSDRPDGILGSLVTAAAAGERWSKG